MGNDAELVTLSKRLSPLHLLKYNHSLKLSNVEKKMLTRQKPAKSNIPVEKRCTEKSSEKTQEPKGMYNLKKKKKTEKPSVTIKTPPLKSLFV